MTYLQPDIPKTFEEMLGDQSWIKKFMEWADDQPDWTGPLTRAVFGINRWDGSLPAAHQIVEDLRQASPPLSPTVTVLDPDLVADGSGNIPADFFDEAYAEAYGILANDRFIYSTFYHDGAQAAADKLMDRKRNSKWATAEDQAAEDVTVCQVWIQTPTGAPQIVRTMAGEMDYYWEPTEADVADSLAKNAEAVKAADDGEPLPFWQWFHIVLIGSHGRDLAPAYKPLCTQYGVEGTVTVEKGSGFSAGSLTFSGAHDPDAVRRHVAQFSKKTCYFV